MKGEKTLNGNYFNILTGSSSIDQLTGIFNRSGFEKMVEKKCEESNGISYMLVEFDINNFRVINKKYGAIKATELLRTIVSSAKGMLGEEVVFARIERDTFILFTEKDQEFLVEFQKVLNSVVEKLGVDKYVGVVEFSFGVYEIEQLNECVSIMMEKTFIARRMAKKSTNVNMVWYNSRLEQSLEEEKYYDEYILDAINNKELKVFFQPKLRVKDNAINSVEALVRWVLPDGKMIYPDAFIPLFEKSGKIMYLDLYIINEVCQYLSEQKKCGMDSLIVSINISKVNLYLANFIEQFFEILERHEIKSEQIQLEVAEDAFVKRVGNTLENLRVLDEKGIVIAMDSFATGYSCLRLLPELPVRILKLDRKFLRSCDNSPRMEIVIENIISLAHKLEMEVICEGAEDKEDMELLRKLECDGIQGHYIMKPVLKEEYRKELDKLQII